MTSENKIMQRQIMLQDLMTNDPVLAEESPETVAQAYNAILQLAPEMATNKEVVRAVLRQTIHSVAVSPYDAEVWTKLEKNLMNVRGKAPISVNTEVCPNCWNNRCTCTAAPSPSVIVSEPEFQRLGDVLVPSAAMALAEPDKWRVMWSEPWPGFNAEGDEVTANVDYYASLQDCIAIARHALRAQNRPDIAQSWTDELLLDQFCTVHWATIVREPE